MVKFEEFAIIFSQTNKHINEMKFKEFENSNFQIFSGQN